MKDIEQTAPSKLEQGLSSRGAAMKVTVRNVSCARSGSTQNYTCHADAAATDPTGRRPSIHQRLTIIGACNSKGACVWRSI